ncbi:hypothetical protein [Streptomyces cupreus]|uniref:Sensor domain-containing protein n=1 Tax=Streptomyces cupreus TaxID=2759956 RepID=A0A7X1JBG0_9ACTN|nr:hypothetical protein [Streptomyces cupreus]MBC2907190.1 hypothetical protein [Streptomyces cupreus]
MKRAALAASASALSLTAVLTACSDESDTDAKPESSPSSAQAKQVSPAERLAKLMVTDADLDGETVQEIESEFLFAEAQDEVTVDKPVCAPLAYAMNQLPLGEAQADLARYTSTGPAATYIALAAYGADGDAESAMAGLSKAIDSCGGGFTAKANGNTSPYDSVAAEQASAAGDETLAFKSTMTFRGASHVLRTQAVRSGDVIAVYFAVNGTAIANAQPSEAQLAKPVVRAQNKKLG